MMANKRKQKSETARRLIALRTAWGYPQQKAFAHFLQVEPTRYANLEGAAPLSREVALILVKKIPGLTLDWLYLGREDGLSGALLSKIRKVQGSELAG